MENPSSDDPSLSPLAREILAYLESHAAARDSLAGIAEWWLLEREIVRETAKVRRALAELVARGLVEEIAGRPGEAQFRANRPGR